MNSSSPKTFLCDFDGTISRTCLCDFLYSQFATCGLKYSDMWAEGKVGTKEEIETTFQFIHASRTEMEKALDTIEVVPGFKQFYETCREQGYNLIIVSDGLEWAIRYVIASVGVKDIQVMSNRIFFEGEKYRFEFPFYSLVSPKVGVYKLDIARNFKKDGRPVFLIGDGKTDFDAAQAVDFVFARDALWEFCQEKKLPSFHYENFFDILKYIEDPARQF
jgi:2-hydroxy-3-keto-5-methylthiopentenyl-1-phosphate phosphatase